MELRRSKTDELGSQVEQQIDGFIRTQFGISPTDPAYDREVDLFESGYVDSMGIVELLEFLRGEFEIEIADDDLLADEFSNVAGISRIVSRTLNSRNGGVDDAPRSFPRD